MNKTETFSFPKSLYAVEDAILPLLRDKKNALVLDFFAGSGTTFHATCLMNWRDGGSRRSISVTNNEVSAEVAGKLQKIGAYPGSPDYDAAGVCEAVTWPRMKATLTGLTPQGNKVPGTYLGTDSSSRSRALSDGFEENAEYFRLDFLDPNEVARGDAFKAIFPLLWLMAGSVGERQDHKSNAQYIFPKKSPFAVLLKEKQFRAFREKLANHPYIKWIFLVTDAEENFALMRRELGNRYECIQLYKSYLENFRINTQEALTR